MTDATPNARPTRSGSDLIRLSFFIAIGCALDPCKGVGTLPAARRRSQAASDLGERPVPGATAISPGLLVPRGAASTAVESFSSALATSGPTPGRPGLGERALVSTTAANKRSQASRDLSVPKFFWMMSAWRARSHVIRWRSSRCATPAQPTRAATTLDPRITPCRMPAAIIDGAHGV